MIKSFFESISNFPKIGIADLFEIFIIIFIVYKLINTLKNTRAWIILKGLGILYITYALTELFNLHVLSKALQIATLLTTFAVMMALQPDIRRIIEKLGNKKITDFNIANMLFEKQKQVRYSDKTIKAIVDSVVSMAKVKTGSLIVIEKDTPLNDIIASGINLNADVSSQLLVNIFEDKTPLHDGAVIIRGDRILSATAYLPLTNNSSIDKELGTRHRAAIGATEASDCFVIVTSEETGQISFVKNGIITRDLNKEKLTELLKEEQTPKHTIETKNKFFKNPGVKTSAAVLGFFIWFAVMTGIDPVMTKEFKNVHVFSTNKETIKDKIIELEKDKINVTLEDRKSVIDKIHQEDITAVADLRKLSPTGAVKPNINIKKNSTTKIVSTSDDVLNAKIDEIGYLEFPIDIEFIGKLDQGSSLKEIQLNPSKINLSGGKSTLKKLGKIICTVNLNELKANKKIAYSPKFFDKNGDEIPNDKIKVKEATLEYNAIIEPVKNIMLNVSATDSDLSAGKITSIEYNPKSVTIRGSEEDLSKINSLNIEIPISIEIADADNKKMTKVININDFLSKEFRTTEGNDRLEININYEPHKNKRLILGKSNIKIKGLNSELEYKISDSTSIPVKAFAKDDVINTIKNEDISAEVDLSSITVPGDYRIPIAISSEKAMVFSETKEINIKISKKGADN